MKPERKPQLRSDSNETRKETPYEKNYPEWIVFGVRGGGHLFFGDLFYLNISNDFFVNS